MLSAFVIIVARTGNDAA
ncbi:peptide chain release factor 2 [Parvularcula bermudensis HTCC2503]|uniref:Peptide chain release factor 2 n=1 Tax=Parvularcula bermudensis (strain ATCC BAA-594 / HTCC2503 / KCTC 12087) TaxID=314260 RepID=E0TG60_PARBH|nr:peptide chain release factor 2 [Parvularcula bermudensis HTCC2503]